MDTVYSYKGRITKSVILKIFFRLTMIVAKPSTTTTQRTFSEQIFRTITKLKLLKVLNRLYYVINNIITYYNGVQVSNILYIQIYNTYLTGYKRNESSVRRHCKQ